MACICTGLQPRRLVICQWAVCVPHLTFSLSLSPSISLFLLTLDSKFMANEFYSSNKFCSPCLLLCDSVPLSFHIISSSLLRGSTSLSGPSLPNPGSFTPTSVLLSQPFCGSKPMQVELDLQLDANAIQICWETNGLLWSTSSDMLLGDNFELSAIPPIKICTKIPRGPWRSL